MSEEHPSVAERLDDELAAILETDGQPVSTEGREGQFTDAMKEQLADLGYLVD